MNGPSLPPLSGGSPKQLVLLLHGYGSNGADLISLAPHWRQALPDALFLAPNAPGRCQGMADAYQWWEISEFTQQALAAGTTGAAPVLDSYIDEQLEAHGLTEHQLAIVGFSQGTMLGLHVGLRREHQVAGIVGYSGMLIGAASLAREPITKPPVLLIHGSADPIVPVIALHEAKVALRRLGLEVEAHISQGLGHSVDPTGLRMGGEFVRRVLIEGAAVARPL
jgi:phospholipase/carboxylesterase